MYNNHGQKACAWSLVMHEYRVHVVKTESYKIKHGSDL